MEDGSFGTSKGVYLCTDCYTKTEVYRLASILRVKFELNTSVHKANSRFRIYILKGSVPRLREIVESHFHVSMLYRIG